MVVFAILTDAVDGVTFSSTIGIANLPPLGAVKHHNRSRLFFATIWKFFHISPQYVACDVRTDKKSMILYQVYLILSIDDFEVHVDHSVYRKIAAIRSFRFEVERLALRLIRQAEVGIARENRRM